MRELSVDRLSFGSHVELAELHDQERSPQKFYGWAKLTIKDAVNNGRMVVPRPIEAINPYHAEIVLPDMKDLDASEEQDQHALSLAMSATWLPRPASKQESAATTS